MLIDRWGRHQDDAGIVCSDLWVGDYLLQVCFVLFKRNVLVVLGFGEGSIIGAKENELAVSAQ